jgi:hypothetical protein
MPIQLEKKEYNRRGKTLPPRKAAPSAEVADDGVDVMNDIVQKQKMQNRADSAVGRITKFQDNPLYTAKDARRSLRKKSDAPVGV